jgi:hypothetical protein
MRVARPVVLTDVQQNQLRAIANSKTASVRFAQRVKMILLAGDGLQDKQIAATVGVRRQAVALWRGRFLDLGIDGIAKDAPRGGRHRTARSPQKVRAISASWLNMVERFFRDLTGKRLKRGVFTSVPTLIHAINAYIQTTNQSPKPFLWTAKATDILEKVKLARESLHMSVTG